MFRNISGGSYPSGHIKNAFYRQEIKNMIVSHINNSDKYFCLHRHLKEAFVFLRTLDKSTKPQSFSFDGFSGSIVAVKTDKKQEESELEAHREYLDIHYVLCGEECFGYADVSSLTPTTDYNSEKDCILLKGGMDKLLLKEGEFCIVFPEDAHLPGGFGQTTDKLKKAIVKIKLD